MGDVSFTASEIGVITAILTAMATPIGVLFWALLSSMRERIKREQELVDRLAPGLDRVSLALEQEIAQSKFLREQLEKRLERSAGLP